MYGLTRGTMTLIGAAGAGLLLWLASQVNEASLGGFWAFVGLTAAAGLTMAFSQLLGGWTKWGWPRVSGSVFLLGFLPGLVAGGLVLLAAQPDSSAVGTSWADDLGAGGLAADLSSVLPAIAFGLGLLFGLTFDTTGPRVREVDVVDEDAEVRRPGYVAPAPADASAADEPVTAERGTVDTPAPARTTTDDRAPVAVGAGAYPDRDRDGVDDRDEAPQRRRLFTFHR
jgi:hypothetical protein